MLQFNETLTVVFPGLYSNRILTFNWLTMQWTRQEARLTGWHASGACSLLKGSDGKTVVAIAGGREAGKH